MRINKYLASTGLASRRSSEAMILEGRVKVNGHLVRNLSYQVELDAHVTVDGKKVRSERSVTVLLNKPSGVICSTEPQGMNKTVFDYLPSDLPRMFYIGRLDVDSEGMLVMTNDGDLSQKLSHPKHKVPKIYFVKLDREFDFALAPKMKKGFLIESGFANMESIYHLNGKWVKVILTQGLKRQIRLMFLRVGYKVRQLKRVQIGNLEIGALKTGKWRYLKDEEIQRDLLGARLGDRGKPERREKNLSKDKSDKKSVKDKSKLPKQSVAGRPASSPHKAKVDGKSSTGKQSRRTNFKKRAKHVK
ncbi:MAG: pseudouridine synthase [Verrucomicrobiota bacterium]